MLMFYIVMYTQLYDNYYMWQELFLKMFDWHCQSDILSTKAGAGWLWIEFIYQL